MTSVDDTVQPKLDLLRQPEPMAFVGPAGLRELDLPALTDLAEDIRRFLLDHVSATGGHLGSNLGVVELTIALHRAFSSPADPILFDTGHQAYVHKILTGRAGRFGTLRQFGGLSGYPSRTESLHDVIENSHASTALSYADGLAKAFRLRGETGRIPVVVLGDGALTGGMCWEALNNIGAGGRPIVVVLNDNERSYAPTVGAMAEHLRELRDHSQAGGLALFDYLNLAYLGPVDGHDLVALHRAFTAAKALDRPVVVHVVTVKGKGFRPAEVDEADRMHGIGIVDRVTGRPRQPTGQSWTSVFEDAMLALGRRRRDVVAITAAMTLPVGFGAFASAFPDRLFDVGMAEQHAVTSAAGLATGGLHPVVAIYATFLNRAFDQVLMDVGLHRLPVTFVLDRAGVTGPDGPSHHGMWDLAMLGMVPGMRVACPRDATQLGRLLEEAVDIGDGPTAIRYPKASVGPSLPTCDRIDGLDVLARNGSDVLLVAVGAVAPLCLAATKELRRHGLAATVVDPRWVLPVNPALVGMAAAFRQVCVVEDGVRAGGVGSAVAQSCLDSGTTVPVRSIGLPGRFLPHGSPAEVRQHVGLTVSAIVAGVLDSVALS